MMSALGVVFPERGGGGGSGGDEEEQHGDANVEIA